MNWTEAHMMGDLEAIGERQMIDDLIPVGWVALDDKGEVLQPMNKKQWYTRGPTPAVRRLYKTESVAKRYGTPAEAFIVVTKEKHNE